jgi:hypothetical protein
MPGGERKGRGTPLSMRGGGAAMVLVVALAALLVVGAVLLLWPAPDIETAAQPELSPRAAPERVAPRIDLPSLERTPSAPPAGDPERPPPAYPAELFSSERFRGVGTLRVIARTAGDAPFPREWHLALEPSRVLIGGEHAERRRIELRAGERELELADLALGGYELEAAAEGMSSESQQIMLARPDETLVVVHVVLRPAGFITGLVVDPHGEAVEELPILLEDVRTRERREARTDPAGRYLFEGVLDGEYILHLGSADSPLARARELSFQAPSMHVPVLEVPRLGSLVLRVVDSGGLEVSGARIQGYGSAGGRIEATTGNDGRATARFLPEGRYTVIAVREGVGRAHERVQLAAGETREVELRLEP